MFSLGYSVLVALFLQAVDGSSWPKGKYALLKPVTGCPEGWVDKGWLLQDTVDDNGSNNRSETLHIDGYVSPTYVIRSFCVKITTYDHVPYWPQGRYCMYRKMSEGTLTGMRAGWIKMYDETTSNKDTVIYLKYNEWIYHSLSSYYKHLVLYFQCKTSGSINRPISLPITKPFYLLPYGSRDCQQVQWMVATSEWIRYQTRNYNGRRYKDGTVPYHKLGNVTSKGITMYYCYYRSCNYTLTDKEGVFQSPGFPGQYPDGQLCSWRIMVPDNHTLHVRFTNFSLEEKDVLGLYKYDLNDTAQLAETLYGFREPFILTGTADLLFKFVSNEEGHGSGFRAEYTVFIPGETTQPPSSTLGTSSSLTTRVHSSTPRASIPFTANIVMSTEHIPEISTTESMSKNRTAFALQSKCQGISTIVVIVTPLVCLVIVVIAIVIVVCRYRLPRPKPERAEDKIAANPIYDQDILLNERGSITTISTTMDSNGRQMYQTLSRDRKQTTNDDDGYSNGQMYQSLSPDQKPGCDENDEKEDPIMNSGYPKYHELEPIDNKVPDVVYDVFQGPDPNDGPTDDPTYQSMDEETIHESLYQYTMPGTMVTQDRLYDSLA